MMNGFPCSNRSARALEPCTVLEYLVCLSSVVVRVACVSYMGTFVEQALNWHEFRTQEGDAQFLLTGSATPFILVERHECLCVFVESSIIFNQKLSWTFPATLLVTVSSFFFLFY